MINLKVKKYFDNRIILFSPKIFEDERGFFYESYNKKNYKKYLKNINFIQDNISLSKKKHTIRGIHFQKPPFHQSKLVTVLEGEILDIVLDINPKSKDYGNHKLFRLDSKNKNLLFISEDFAHGFCTLQKNTKVLYKVTNFYKPNYEKTILWSDKFLKIKWPKSNKYIISNKDKKGSSFKSMEKIYNSFK